MVVNVQPSGRESGARCVVVSLRMRGWAASHSNVLCRMRETQVDRLLTNAAQAAGRRG